MNSEQQRIKIAEACGWKCDNYGLKCLPPDALGGLDLQELPDYLNDLNAMHDAEKMLTPEQCSAYNNYLCDVKRPYHKTLPQSERWTWGSSAEQRAEAFLKTLNLWIE